MIEGERERLLRIIVPSVQAVLLRPGDNDMEIFLGLRATKSHHLQWAPPGGKVDPGETDQLAAIREAREEAGVYLDSNRLIYFKDMPVSHISGFMDGQSVLFQSAVRVFLVDARNLEPFNASPREHVEMKWMRVSDALDMHERILSSRPDMQDRHSIPGTLTQGTAKTVKWLLGK